eukprot:scaffold6171_cov83-Skeletonema_dohrnii-CCMP3373.AAC.2
MAQNVLIELQQADEVFVNDLRYSSSVSGVGSSYHVDRTNGGELCHDHHAHVAELNSSSSRQITVSRNFSTVVHDDGLPTPKGYFEFTRRSSWMDTYLTLAQGVEQGRIEDMK